MERRWFDSPPLYAGLAGLLLIAAVASQFELRVDQNCTKRFPAH